MSTINAPASFDSVRRLRHCIAILLAFLLIHNAFAQTRQFVLHGSVTDAATGGPLAGVNILVQNTTLHASTDDHGRYQLSVVEGHCTIVFSCVGYEKLIRTIDVNELATRPDLDAALTPSPYLMGDVIVNANRESGNRTPDTLKAKDLLAMPMLFSNIVSGVKILPGVTSNNELSSTYNVRGGNFDENLIYLNGFEIYQPYLVQQGIEQSQSLLNEEMVSSMEFYHGAFPVQFGDKMSSALAVHYYTEEHPGLKGEFNADLFTAGLTLHDKSGALSWRGGVRYAYPSLFDNILQTSGTYKPNFRDIQLQGTYSFTNDVEVQLLLITARNSFDLAPKTWIGNVLNWGSIGQANLAFSGTSTYQSTVNLAGLKGVIPVAANSRLTASLDYYTDREVLNKNVSYHLLSYESVYPVVLPPHEGGSGTDNADHSLDARRLDASLEYAFTTRAHAVKAGADVRYSAMESVLDESSVFHGADTTYFLSQASSQRLNTDFNALSVYLDDIMMLSSTLSADVGVRTLRYYFNDEFLVSPRAGLSFKPDTSNTFSLSYGWYYQPPYFYETWDKSLVAANSLKAQKDVQYNASWSHRSRHRSTFTTEIYYKKLSRLIPYSVDDLQLTYGAKNDHNGYAYGLDLQYEGQAVPGMNTWVGYSFSNTQERETSGNHLYQSRPMDQTHTIRIFLQDRARTSMNFQSHLLLLVGSGYHYYPMMIVPGSSPTSSKLVPDFGHTYEYPFFFRADMGLTFAIELTDDQMLTLSADVLNVFNKNNVVSYSWFQLSSTSKYPTPVPNILSPRFFNVGVKYEF